MMEITLLPISDPAVLAELAREAREDGKRMVDRLVEEWTMGKNRFEQTGERSYVARLDGKACGVCGLNIDPFADEQRIGRVRRLYVAKAHRRRGIGSLIINQIIQDAAGNFDLLHLRTYDPIASRFYQSIGFSVVAESEFCTHQLKLHA